MAYVTIRLKGIEGHSQTDLGKDRMILGRASKNELPIAHTSISREHCAFVREQGAWFIEDLGSSNGTWLNKDKLAGKKPLKERDIVKAGKARVTFHEGERKDGAEVAVDIELDDDGDKGPTRTVGAEDPPEAMPCAQCGLWFSIAHRLAGESMDCPRCGHGNVVPSMNT